MSDSRFVLYLHGDPRLADIVDLEWEQSKLASEKIEVPPELVPRPKDDDMDSDGEQREDDQDKWADTGSDFGVEADPPRAPGR
ncbi:hypothetical protein HK105_204053 [Polyrhizophydium stewartii]|uniref:Anaphase-promoting complex subunit 13 n=1 Tax=Polyrhizophydium stewartii TaxID=2732419 RepID=A0ABR4N9U0_9FUNG|nr:hypothetical protein HK105_004668 [Polyrhizophydium stewartii]